MDILDKTGYFLFVTSTVSYSLGCVLISNAFELLQDVYKLAVTDM
jgi:hypothetical protein